MSYYKHRVVVYIDVVNKGAVTREDVEESIRSALVANNWTWDVAKTTFHTPMIVVNEVMEDIKSGKMTIFNEDTKCALLNLLNDLAERMTTYIEEDDDAHSN